MEDFVDPNVSIILPTYNRTRTLGAAIASVLGQSYKDFELIVVDDASQEDVAQFLDGIDDPRLRYARREVNGGAAAARNTGLELARGHFIAFQDSDDIWLPGKLMKQVSLLSSLPESVGVVTGGKIIYGRDARFRFGAGRVAQAPPPETRLSLDEDQFAHLLTENRISLQNALFRRNCMAGPAWFDQLLRANEDWEFAIRLVKRTRIYEDIEPVVLGFISPDSISSNTRRQLMGELRIMRKNRRALEQSRRHRSRLRIDAALNLYRIGKKRTATRFLLAGLRDRPANTFSVLPSVLKRVFRGFRKISGFRTVLAN
jgi:glycosyltransferase involved in cell wall biosynthesis